MVITGAAAGDWQQCFKAGSADPLIGGTEIIHLVAHKGRLYAGNGYWMDPRGPAKTGPRPRFAQWALGG